MRKMVILSAAFLSSALAFVPGVSAGSPLADRLPDDTCAYIGWAGRTPAFDGTLLGQMLDDPAIVGMLDLIKQVVRSPQGGMDDSEMSKAIGPAIDLGCMALRHPMAISVFGLKAEPGGKPEIGLAVLVDVGKDKEAFDKLVQQLIDALGKDAAFEKSKVAALPCRTMKLDDKYELTIASSGDIMFMSIGLPQMAERLAQVKPDKSLASSQAFAEAMKAVGIENQQAAVYVNVDHILQVVKQATTPPEAGGAASKGAGIAPADGGIKPDPSPWEIVNALGVGKISAIAGAMQIADKNFFTRVRIFTPAPHQGLLMPFAGQPITEADLACAPDDADFLLAFRLSPDAAFTEFRRVLRLIDAQADKNLAHGMAELESDLGISIDKDLLASLGDTWTLCEAQSQGGLLTGTILTIQAKNVKKLQEVQAKIENYLKEKVFAAPKMQPGTDPELQAMIPQKTSPSIKVVKYNQAEIHYLALSKNMPVAPAWTIYKDRLMVALFPQVLMAAVDNYGLKPLAKDPEYAKLRAKVSDKACMLMYGDSSRITKEIYPILLVVGTVLANSMPGADKGGDFIYPAALSRLQKYASRDVSGLWADDKGIVFENIANGGTSSTPTLAMAAGTSAAIMLPTLGRARALAKRAASQSNLSAIGKAIALFGGEFNDKCPTNLGLLVAYRNMISPKALVSPASATKPPKVDEKGNITGPIDYVYFVLDEESPGETIMAYDPPENFRNEGTNVLLKDCSVRWVDMATFKEMMETSAKEHKRCKGKGYNPFEDSKK
ncbi:MAG: hypothetical protein HZA50_04655 [Planctomycetes bacterium]|nr:hypothetical protein [Planctomycetota bacterium]